MEKERLVLDSSVVVKWFSQEDNTDAALKIREKLLADECEVSVPDLQFYEVSNALRYNPEITTSDIAYSIQSLFNLGMLICTPTETGLGDSIRVARLLNLSVYDAYFLVLANSMNAVLVTSDRSLYEKAIGYDVKLLSEMN